MRVCRPEKQQGEGECVPLCLKQVLGDILKEAQGQGRITCRYLRVALPSVSPSLMIASTDIITGSLLVLALSLGLVSKGSYTKTSSCEIMYSTLPLLTSPLSSTSPSHPTILPTFHCVL